MASSMRCLLALLLLAGWAVAWGAQGPAAELVLGPGVASMRVERGVEVLIEEAGENLDRDAVMRPALAPRWTHYAGKQINLARENRPVWIRFNVRFDGDAGTPWLLGVGWPVQKSLDFHQFDQGPMRWVASHYAGLSRAAASQLMKDPAPVFPLVSTPGGRSTILLRVQTDSQLAVPLTLWSEKAFQAQSYDRGVLTGLLFGILGVMLFYNLSLYVFTRERSFLSYSVYLLSIVFYELSATGFGPLYLWENHGWLKARGYEFFSVLSFLAATVFFRHFLDLKRAGRYLNLINVGFLVFWSLVLLMSMFPATQLLATLIGAGGLISAAAGTYTSLYLALRGDVLARYFLIAWAVVIAGTVVTLMTMFGVVETGSWWVDYSQQLGFVVETVLLSIALAERIKREKRSKEAAQQESMELARRVQDERDAKLLAQEQTLSLQQRVNEELELRVLDRTAEVERAMKNLEIANVELAKLSVTDALTKAHNRRYFDETLKKEYDRSVRTGTPLSLLLADIDHFKAINDSVGHLAGDECLKLVAATLAATVGRSTDLVARYGGEEFAVVLPATGAEHAMEVAERIRHAVEHTPFIYRGQRIALSISLGVVSKVAGAGETVSQFVAQADEALYAAKRAGRNRVQVAVNE